MSTELSEELQAVKNRLAKSSPLLAKQMETGVVTPIPLARALDVVPQYIYARIRQGGLAHNVTPDTNKIVIPLEAALTFVKNRWEAEAKKKEEIEAELSGNHS